MKCSEATLAGVAPGTVQPSRLRSSLRLFLSLTLCLFVSLSLLPLPPVQQKYLSQEGYTVSKSACRNGQSASLLSDSGLVMYFSTLPAPSSSAPCILTILTRLKPRATPGDSRWQGKISLEGYTPAKMAARAATPPYLVTSLLKLGSGSAPKKN